MTCNNNVTEMNSRASSLKKTPADCAAVGRGQSQDRSVCQQPGPDTGRGLHSISAQCYQNQICDQTPAFAGFAVSTQGQTVNECATALAQKRNAKVHTALTPAQTKRRAAYARLVASLAPRKQGGLNQPINTGPLNVRRATGVMASI